MATNTTGLRHSTHNSSVARVRRLLHRSRQQEIIDGISNSNVPFLRKPTHTRYRATLVTRIAAAQSPIAAAPPLLEALRGHLESGNFREADEETRRLLIVLAGEAAEKRGYVFFSEVKSIAAADLQSIDELWREHSDGRFGYSVQKRIFESSNKGNKDFTRFFIRVGWMKKLDNPEVDHFNYRSFPSEFIWDINDDTPEGHLPLTNALRGTQLLKSIFQHPAFDHVTVPDEPPPLTSTAAPSSTGSLFKPNYSF